MESKMRPNYANLFVGCIGNKFLSNYHGPKPDLYKRYNDECVDATSSKSTQPIYYLGQFLSPSSKIKCHICYRIYTPKNDTDMSNFNVPNHSHHNMTICELSLHHANRESRKNLEQKFIFQLGTL